jgi:hypothetical protein
VKREPVEALMNRGCRFFKPTSEDLLVIQKWKWRLAALYGAILLILVVFVFAGRSPQRTEIATDPSSPSLSAAALAGNRTSR